MNKRQKVKRMRMTKGFKILLAAFIFLIVGGSIGLYVLTYEPPEQPHYGDITDVDITDTQGDFEDLESNPLHFMVIDVGQAQSLFVDYGEMEVLIDAGYYEGSDVVADAIRDYVDGEIEYAIGTHSHADHIGGFSTIYEEYTIKKTIYGALSSETPCQIFEENGRVEGEFVNDENTVIKLGKNASITIYDLTDDDKNTNNNSVVCLLEHGENKFFFTGDLEEELEVTMRGKLPACDVVVAGHHGADTSNTLLDELKPQYFIISAGANNDYGHPHKSVMEDALEYSRNVFGTWKSGTILFTSDGISLSSNLKAKDMLSMDDVGAKVKVKKEKEEKKED